MHALLVRTAFACATLLSLARAAAPSIALTLPPEFYAVPGVPVSIYFDNIVLTEHPENFRFEVSSDIGTSETRRWTATPRDSDTGAHRVHVTVKDAKGTVLGQAESKLRVARRGAGADRSLRLLIVGDSLTNATHYPNEIARLLDAPENPRWTMFGTHRPSNAKPRVAHEGYSGWTWSRFIRLVELPPSANTPGQPLKRTMSPFLYVNSTGNPQLDIPRYIRENCDAQGPDVVTFLLGINDCFRAKPDDPADIEKTISTTLENAEVLLAAFRAAKPDVVLAVGLTTPPNAREEGFVASYKGNFHRWGWKRIQHRLVQRMLAQFRGRERDGIHIVPTQLNLDPLDGYPPNNGVHPNPTGYNQIGASFYSWLKFWLDQNSVRKR